MALFDATNYVGKKKRLQIEGWRGISHSFAMVNQHQILALMRAGLLEIYHYDLPFFMPHWNVNSNSAGFDAKDTQLINSLSELDDAEPDFYYQICFPFPIPRIPSAKTLTFMVAELGLDANSLKYPDIPLSAYTNGENLVVTPSRWSRDRLLDSGLDEASVSVVPHGVDGSVFCPVPAAERVNLRKNLGIESDTTVFLNVGAPLWNKGIDLLLLAYARAHRLNSNTRLIIKDGSQLYGFSLQSAMGNFAKEYPDLVSQTFLDSISIVSTNLSQIQLAQLYAVCDCYVSPYRAEGFNLPVLEALSCGKQIIVSSGGSTDDFCHGAAVRRIPSALKRGPIGGHNSACWVEPDIAVLVNLMHDIVTQGPNNDDLEKAAFEQAQLYSWDSVANKLIKLYYPEYEY
jgi:glycosyltransferase involved in cell wall biosynthesis